MKIRFDDTGRVEGYAEVGDMPGAVEWTGPIPEGFNAATCRFYRQDGDTLVLVPEWQQEAEKAEADANELLTRLEWFDWYDLQIKEYERAKRLGETVDEETILALDEQARENAARIRELRGEETNES